MNDHRASPRIRRRSGFTLVEVLASLLFLAIAVPAIVGALGIASRTSEMAERSSLAGSLAENKLNEMLVDSAWQSAAQTNGDFGTDFPLYRWQMSTQAWAGTTANTGTTSTNTSGTGTMTELAVEVFYPVQGNEHSVRLTTLVSTTATTGATNGTGTTTGTGTSSSSTSTTR